MDNIKERIMFLKEDVDNPYFDFNNCNETKYFFNKILDIMLDLTDELSNKNHIDIKDMLKNLRSPTEEEGEMTQKSIENMSESSGEKIF